MAVEEAPDDELSNLASLALDYYDPEMIAEGVVWPLIDRLAGEDWRDHAMPGHEMKFTKHGIYEGGLTVVKLAVDCMFSPDEDGRIDTDDVLMNMAILEVAKTEEDWMRDMLFSNIPYKQRKVAMEGVNEDGVVAKHATSYCFIDEQQELVEGSVSQVDVLQDPNGNVKWSLQTSGEEEEYEEEYMESKFRDHDLDKIGFGARLLIGGSAQYEPVIANIRRHPIQAL